MDWKLQAVQVPMPPPLFETLLDEIIGRDPQSISRIFGHGKVSAATDDYLSWQEMRYRTPPAGLDLQEWWLATKFARRAVSRELPVRMVDDRRFSYTLPDELLKLAEEVSQRASGHIAISEQVTNTATRDRYIISSLIEEAITSSQLEGASTSRIVAKDMIRSGRSARDRSEQMILNNFRAMQLVREVRDQRLTPELVCEIHRTVTENTLDNPNMAGQLQSNPDPADRVAVFSSENEIVHRPPSVDSLPARLVALCDFANSESGPDWIHPLVRALTVHFMVGYDHYFEDGNGRTARALFYWSMLQQGYWLTEFLSISRILKMAPSKYMRSYILSEQDDGDLTYFLIYHARVVRRAIDEFDSYLSKKVADLQETRALLAATPGEYNYRQLAILESAMKDSTAAYTAASHAKSHNVSGETARQDLMDLQHRGLLERRKISRQFVWVPAADLAQRIKASD